MKNYKKIIAAVLVVAIVASCAVGATLAWLQDETDEVVNTFTTSKVEIELDESNNLDLEMVPGKVITKDPKVTVVAGSEACYVFVKIEKSDNYGTYLEEYKIADGWKELDGVEGVYYREVDEIAADEVFYVLKDNQVVVKTGVTNDNMTAANENAPTLTFTAYAVQKDNVADENAAWRIAQGLDPQA